MENALNAPRAAHLAALPLSDSFYTREQKTNAIRARLLHGKTLRDAAATVGPKCSPHSVKAWVSEYNERMRAADAGDYNSF